MPGFMDSVSGSRDVEGQNSRIYGLVIGVVCNNKDPDKMGRVKVKFPWLADEVESNWCRVAYPMNGKERGFFWLPEIDDEVLIGFLFGDVNMPYVVGGLYNGKDLAPQTDNITKTFKAPSHHADNTNTVKYSKDNYAKNDDRDYNKDGKNDLRFIRSRSGHMFIFDDKENHEKITLADKTGERRIEISTVDKKIVITSVGSEGDIELWAERKISLHCEKLYTYSHDETKMYAKGKFEVKSDDDMTHFTKANMKREAKQNIDEKAGTNTTLEAGTNMTAKAGANVEVKGGANADFIAGAMGTVKAGGQMTVKGAQVMIN